MRDNEFEWDDAKAATNAAKHGVRARRVFDDPFAISRSDRRQDYGEERFNIIGMAGDRLLHVTYTLSNDRVRILSARGVEPHERRRYHEEED